MTRTKAKRAAIYARRSEDRSGLSESVPNQIKDCQKLATAEGLDVVQVFQDAKVSAYSGVRRPEYERLMAAVESGEVDVILCSWTDRLYRRLADLLPLTDLLKAHGVVVHAVHGGEVDLATPEGQLRANIMGSVAQYESAHRSDRVTRAAESRALAGRFGGGGRRFGYTPTGDALIPAEAAAIRWAYDHVHEGGTLYSVATDWTRRGLTGPQGATFEGRTVKDVLLRPMNAGLAVYRGEIVGDSLAPPVVSPETFYAVRAILSDPSRRKNAKKAGAPGRALLVGLVWCTVCKQRAFGQRRWAPDKTVTLTYSCRMNHASRRQDKLDAAVSEAALAFLEKYATRFRRPVAATDPAPFREAERLRQKLADLGALLDADELDPLDYARASKAARVRLAEVESSIAVSSGTPASSALLASGDPTAYWNGLDTDGRRTVLAECIERIDLSRNARADRGKWSMDATEITWRD